MAKAVESMAETGGLLGFAARAWARLGDRTTDSGFRREHQTHERNVTNQQKEFHRSGPSGRNYHHDDTTTLASAQFSGCGASVKARQGHPRSPACERWSGVHAAVFGNPRTLSATGTRRRRCSVRQTGKQTDQICPH